MIVAKPEMMAFLTDTSSDPNDMSFAPNRRLFLQGAGMVGLLGLTSCGTMRSAGDGGGASSSAAGIVAGLRRQEGLSAMTPDSRLEQAALQQASYMAGSKRMVHTTGWGKDFATRVKGNGIEGAAAENIAEGRMDLTRLFDMWMNSPPHRRNLLDPRFKRFGLAYVRDDKRPDWRYWALVLGR